MARTKLSRVELMLLAAEELMTNAGSFRILSLSKQKAEDYAEGLSRTYDTEVEGPSADNDPLKVNPLYAIKVRRSGVI